MVIITTVLVYILDHPLGAMPALGRLLDPVNGCWASAEPVRQDFNEQMALPGLKASVKVWMDERLVPHIHAGNDHDLYFAEGYIHARFRLWQMDMETRAAAGRISEVVGAKGLGFDRKQRRKGMVYAAEQSLKVGDANPISKLSMDAYTEGINAYITTLTFRSFPLEYKLLGFAPEKWTNLKSALLLKYMADDLTGKTDDMALTYLRDVLPKRDLELLFPSRISGSTPVIPTGTAFAPASLAKPAAPADSLAFPHYKLADFAGEAREDGKGSNNWAISGSRTASGAPILCNDPHLGLNLPSLWYEVQLQTPDMNAYGVSLPGTPGIIIGFNDSLAWGFTNNYRDVKDFYEIKTVAGDKSKYWFNGKQVAFNTRVERISIKGKPDMLDTVKYTVQGPVMYDEHYAEKGLLHKTLAMSWMAHRPTNELLSVYMLNHARNYEQFVEAILHFECPAQNMVYADRSGNIAMWGQGQFVNKWKDQGVYIMNGTDSSTMWKELIPMRENPHVLNPAQGYVSSANQTVTDSTYPYWYNGNFVELRAWRINEVLGQMQHAKISDMFGLQNDTHSYLAERALPIMLGYVANVKDTNLEALRKWNFDLQSESVAATAFQVWWYYFFNDTWKDELANVPDNFAPLMERTLQLMQTDTAMKYFDDIRTSRREYLRDIVVKSFDEAHDSIAKLSEHGSTAWYAAKNTSVIHLTRLAPFSFDHLKTGGWGNTVNAMKGNHGPSWRMVVQMGKDEIEAYGVYPGGQSGNPGSKYYADFLDHWVEGKYYRLLFLPNKAEQNNKELKYTWNIHP